MAERKKTGSRGENSVRIQAGCSLPTGLKCCRMTLRTLSDHTSKLLSSPSWRRTPARYIPVVRSGADQQTSPQSFKGLEDSFVAEFTNSFSLDPEGMGRSVTICNPRADTSRVVQENFGRRRRKFRGLQPSDTFAETSILIRRCALCSTSGMTVSIQFPQSVC
jgi:hypothetical protein